MEMPKNDCAYINQLDCIWGQLLLRLILGISMCLKFLTDQNKCNVYILRLSFWQFCLCIVFSAQIVSARGISCAH